MKVGDYVRTERYIGKIIKMIPHKGNKTFTLEISIGHCIYITIRDCYVLKSSSNIIDLIEVGDYVNGIRVDDIKNGQLKTISYYDNYLCHLCSDYEIKTIVTKEQFESVEYEVFK